MDKDDIVKRIAGLLNEDGLPPSMFHDADEFGAIPSSQAELLAYLLRDWDWIRPAEDFLAHLDRICRTHPIDPELEISVKEEVLQNYRRWQTDVNSRPGHSQSEEGPSLFH